MQSLTATEARKAFFDLLKQANQRHEIFEVQHKSGKAVIMSAADYENLQETLFLMSQPGFKDAFDQSLAEADQRETHSFEEVFGEPL